MTNRAIEIAGFLTQHGWDDAEAYPFDGDWATRRYARLVKPDNSKAIFMDADAGQNTDAFVIVAELLQSGDISSPKIFAADPMNGLVLMEDFGGQNFGAMLDRGLDPKPLYKRAIDVLVHLHTTFDVSAAKTLDLPLFGGALFSAQAELFIDAYIPYACNREAIRDEGEMFRDACRMILRSTERLPQTLLLRDYMPDNLMDLPKREAWRSTGVLDFQDAGIGPIAYDIASLCEQVRRDTGSPLFDEMITYYHEQAQPALSLPELKSACRILSAQRHIRILGIIAALVQKTGRREKLAYIPRIWAHLDTLLQDPALRPMQECISPYRKA